jgi:two-component system, OmpR family, response regulator RegX3
LGEDGSVRVLIVEDDRAIADELAEGLERESFEVTSVSTGLAALEAPLPDVVLLDLRLPDVDGYTVCRELRERSDVPIIIVSAKDEEIDRVLGLELGADDYVVKPFGLREVVARIRAVTRRSKPQKDDTGALRAGGLEIDLRSRRARVAGRDIDLTAKEFDVLVRLASEPGSVVSRRQLLEEVWDTSWYGPTKMIDVHVASLRKKLGDADWIEAVRGVGFRLAALE